MKIIFFGTPKEVIPVLEELNRQFEVVTVITTPDQKAGRKQLMTPSPVKAYAHEHDIPVITPEKFTQQTVDQLQKFNAELFIVAAYGKLIPQNVLTLPKYGAINIHPSFLPNYRGPTPIQTTLLSGDQTSGISFIKMDEHMDHGPILHQIPLTLEKTDTFAWLMQSMFAQAAMIVPQVIDDYVLGKIKPQPQDESLATYTKIISKDNGSIDLDNPPEPDQLDRMIRAYYPWPTVWAKTKLNNKETRIKFLPKNKLQVEGKNAVAVKDFLNGYPEMREKIKKLYK